MAHQKTEVRTNHVLKMNQFSGESADMAYLSTLGHYSKTDTGALLPPEANPYVLGGNFSHDPSPKVKQTPLKDQDLSHELLGK